MSTTEKSDQSDAENARLRLEVGNLEQRLAMLQRMCRAQHEQIAATPKLAQPVAWEFWDGDDPEGFNQRFWVMGSADPAHKPGASDGHGHVWISRPLYTAPLATPAPAPREAVGAVPLLEAQPMGDDRAAVEGSDYGSTEVGYTIIPAPPDEALRLMSMLVKALGNDHPAVDDLEWLMARAIFNARPSQAHGNSEAVAAGKSVPLAGTLAALPDHVRKCVEAYGDARVAVALRAQRPTAPQPAPAAAEASQVSAPVAGKGWRLVPEFATPEMLKAFFAEDFTQNGYIAMLAAAPVSHASAEAGQPVYWEWRHFDASGYPGGWSEWQKVEGRHLGLTVADRLREFRDYISGGKRYELRALFTAPVAATQPAPAPLGAAPSDAEISALWMATPVRDDLSLVICFARAVLARWAATPSQEAHPDAADAQRYRWLRTYPNNIGAAVYSPTGGLLRRDEYLDAAIDAALAAQQQAQAPEGGDKP